MDALTQWESCGSNGRANVQSLEGSLQLNVEVSKTLNSLCSAISLIRSEYLKLLACIHSSKPPLYECVGIQRYYMLTA